MNVPTLVGIITVALCLLVGCSTPSPSQRPAPTLYFPLIEKYGGIVRLQHAAEPPYADARAVLHGDATRRALSAEAYRRNVGEHRADLDLLRALDQAGVEMLVCGQALAHRGFTVDEVDPSFTVVTAAATAILRRQQSGFAYLPFHD